MREVTQRIEGWPHGECVRATYASIFDLPIDAVPPFDPASLAGEDQQRRERKWLASIGYGLVEISTSSPDEQISELILACIPKECIHLISGISPRGLGHRCVGRGGRVFFDPHPSRSGLLTVYSIGFLVPL